MTVDQLQAIEADASAVPVILPLPAQESREATIGKSSEKKSLPAIGRYAFPKLPPQQKEPPKIHWPTCEDKEEARACAKAARKIEAQMSSRRPAMLGFTSPRDGDGKTSLLLGMAPALAARTEGGILVVDANFNKPDLTTRLTTSLPQTADGPALILPTDQQRLSVFLQATRRLESAAAWMNGLRERWSRVLLDLPSLERAEATSLLCYCTGIYLVVRLGHTPRIAISEAARLIPRCGGKLLGCLVVGDRD
jgi:Mrp family chromosome partitioning ATPase